jgi:hypothetical protein
VSTEANEFVEVMTMATVRETERVGSPVRVESLRSSSPLRRWRVEHSLTLAIASLMVVTAAAGLFIDGLYKDGAWAREALRGGDLTTVLLVVPILIGAMLLSVRGSRKAQVVWVGALAYSVYNYAYYVFGSAFNDIFLLHIAVLAASLWAGALMIANLDVSTVAAVFPRARGHRWVGAYLVLVGVVLGGLWTTLAIRFALTGKLMADIPRNAVHLVFAIDLALLVPALIVAGALLWRGSSAGVVFGAAMAVMGALYQVNLLVAGVFQASADVPGAKAFPIEGVAVAAGFALASVYLLAQGARDQKERSKR